MASSLIIRAIKVIESGGDPNQKDSNGYALLHIAICSNDIDTVSYLIDHGANANCIDKYANTPLHYAVRRINVSDKDHDDTILVVKYLLEHGADPNVITWCGQTALNRAIHECIHIDIVKMLLDYGTDKYIKDSIDQTAAQAAISCGRPDIAEFIESYEPMPTKGVNLE